MLTVLRATRGWPRVLALVLLVAFVAGLAHVHPISVSADPVGAVAIDASGHAGHDHDGHDTDHPQKQASSDCGFCAAVAGKYFIAPPVRTDGRLLVGARAERFTPQRLTSAAVSDLFRPPIAAQAG